VNLAPPLCDKTLVTPLSNDALLKRGNGCKLAGKQATATTQPHEPLWHEPVLEAERIIMVDFTATQAWAKVAAPSDNHKGSRPKAAMAKPPNASPPPTIDGMDRLYRQLAEIHAIAAVQLAECTRWRWSDPTSSLVHARAY
jgi:hypothetical protein